MVLSSIMFNVNTMQMFNLKIATGPLSNIDIIKYAQQVNIPHFRGVFMRDTLPSVPWEDECAIVNLNTSSQAGSHWVCYYKNGKNRVYFDSFGQITPIEIQKYLKDKCEFINCIPVIKRNTDIVQAENSSICGQLCLYVLKSLENNRNFQDIIKELLRNMKR